MSDLFRALKFQAGRTEALLREADDLLEDGAADCDLMSKRRADTNASDNPQSNLSSRTDRPNSPGAQLLSTADILAEARHDWDLFLPPVDLQEIYDEANESIDGPVTLDDLLTQSERGAIENLINGYKREFNDKWRCDAIDYTLAGLAGAIAGLVDVFLVATPGAGPLGKAIDRLFDYGVQQFAKTQGWPGPREGRNPVRSAIGFLERKFPANYDQKYPANLSGQAHVAGLSPGRHHLLSLAHDPGPMGLIFSLLNQFQGTSSFIGTDGDFSQIHAQSPKSLSGVTVIDRVIEAIMNWLGHIASDAAGRSGGRKRGTGVPMPFQALLMKIQSGEFGRNKQTFGALMSDAFAKGYDLRHGVAMAVPTVVAEVLTRVFWSLRSWLDFGLPARDCVPFGKKPRLGTMLLTAHGVACSVDGAGALVKGGTDALNILLNLNLVEWCAFSHRAVLQLDWALHGKAVARYRHILSALSLDAEEAIAKADPSIE